MATIRSSNELILSLIDFLKIQSPALDTKPGTVARDLFIEAPSSQLSLIYDELAKISNLQSLRLTTGSELDDLSKNFGAIRKSSTNSSGVGILTFPSIPTTIAINRGSLIYGANGVSFTPQIGVSINPAFANLYKSIATRYANDLQFLGITDSYAVEVPLVASVPGTIGNISKYGLNRVSIPGISNVTNASAFSGGSDQESDTTFRNRVLAIFSGSNVGTALGYRNAILSNTNVIDALVITPGDSLMTRDGTQVYKNTDGSFTILSEGQGGKVDVIILGSNLSGYVDSFIYRDQSNKNDPTDAKNIFVLGQISSDINKTVTRKRIDNLSAGILPAQPVQALTQVTGSLSGTNFKPKAVDSLGRVTGNYELIKDTGVYAGGPWGFDKFHWVSDRISQLPEDKLKGRANGQDNTTFPDVLNISAVSQNISIQNENSSTVAGSSNSLIQLSHFPCSNVTRVFNLTTGERYIVLDQNPNGTGTVNVTGQIKIVGNTLPSPSDILQVDYTWIVNYDPYVDFDGKFVKNNPRAAGDSIDWSLSNAVRRERVTFTLNGTSTFYNATVTHPVASVITANQYTDQDSSVTVVSSGLFLGKLAGTISGLSSPITSINSVISKNTSKETYITAQNDGTFVNTKVIVGGFIQYVVTVILPTDTQSVAGDTITITYGQADTFTSASGMAGNYAGNTITIPVSNVTGAPSTYSAEVNYIANYSDLFTVKLSDLPVSRKGNGFQRNSFVPVKNSNPSFATYKEFQKVVVSGTSTVKLALLNSEFTLTALQIISVVRLSDGRELWNAANVGTVSAATDNNYQLTLTGFNTPINNDSVLIIYKLTDQTRTQPMTFDVRPISTFTGVVTMNIQTGLFQLSGVTFPNGVSPSQLSVIRLSDGAELTDNSTTFNVPGNIVVFPTLGQSILKGGELVIGIFYNDFNLRESVSRLAVTLSDQINNQGILSVFGTTITKAKDVVFTAINSGLTQDLSEAFRNYLGLSTAGAIDPKLFISRMVKVENVTMSGNNVVNINSTYDVTGTSIRNAQFFSNEMIENLSINNVNIILPNTTNNVTNAPKLGDKIRVTFYYANPADSENIFFTRNGTVYSNKFYALVDKVVVSSGFTNSTTGKLTFSFLNQPLTGSRYTVFYDYLAPKPNERIIINYDYNKLIGDATVSLEPQRPISADVLVKQATQLLLNVGIAVVVKPQFSTLATVVAQNVKDKIISTINNPKLGVSINSSDLITVAKSVDGVDRVRVTSFNLDQAPGLVLTVKAQKNQYFAANNISVITEGV